MAVLALQEDDRSPLASLKPPVDPVGLCFYFRQQIVVALDVGPAGRSNLYECEVPLVLGIFFEKTFNREKAFEDAFGIVHTIDPYAEKGRFHALSAQQ